MGLDLAGKVPDSWAYMPGCSSGEEGKVTSVFYRNLIPCSYLLASGPVCAALPSAPAQASDRIHERFAMTGTNAKVWPLSPQDWSTG
jgi:hypothetical protein